MCIEKVNGGDIRDIIDWKYALAYTHMRLTVRDGDRQSIISVRHESGGDIGVSFASPTIDKLQVCKNNCLFCFVKQMPPGQRESLYVRDDDFRLSLMYGSFVTLTNLREEDFVRITTEKITPIYVSVHTTNPTLRVSLMRNPSAGEIMSQLKRIIAAGVNVHAQLVLVPGLNDGKELERSILDLTSLYPGVQSVAVVPVGLTGFREGLPDIGGFSRQSAREVLDVVARFSTRFRRRHNTSLVYAADEFFVLAESDFPPNGYYDDYPQLENGVGISRLFIDSFRQALRATKRRGSGAPVMWITGESSGTLLCKLQHELNAHTKAWVDVVTVKNYLFGGRVTVTGLLGGEDIAAAIHQAAPRAGTRVIIPDITLRQGLFLDGVSLDSLVGEFPHLSIEVCGTLGDELVSLTLAERNDN